MPHSIRLATTQDVPILLTLFPFLSDSYVPDAAKISEALKHPATEIYVVEIDDVVVGTGTLSFRYVPTTGEVGYIDDMVVHPDQRGKGLGEAIAKHLIKRSCEKNCVRVELTSHPQRVAANKLYQKLKFQLRETNCYVLHLK